MPSRALWKGAISFGLVHIPVALHSATTASGVDFDWLDKRSMDPVGYKRINKKTGQEVTQDDIAKGIEYQDGRYVVLSEIEISAAYPKATQSIEIESFVPLADIPLVYLERPYYIAPVGKSDKVYALLRNTLQETSKAGLARVVIQSKQHLAIVLPSGPGLVLNLLRWAENLRSWEGLELPPEGAKAAGLSERELDMAKRLVQDMAGPWAPEKFTDTFKQDIMALVERKAKEGKLETVAPPAANEDSSTGGQVIDLTELLQRSLRKGSAGEKSQDSAAPERESAQPATKPASKSKPSNAKKPSAARSPAGKKRRIV